jgi:hypothetical protein
MIKYQNDTSTLWSNAFPDALPLSEGCNNKTFYAQASKVRFYFYNAAGNININEIKCFADINILNDNDAADNNNCLLIEPEDLKQHELFEPFYVVDDMASCSGQYIETDINGDQNAPSETGRVVVNFYVDSAARYYIYLRVIAPSISDDSFWVITDGDVVKYNLIKASTDWIWVEAPKSYDFEKGLHNLQIVRRENNTKLDQILISTSANLPTGCNSCTNIYDPSIVYHTLNTTVNGSGSIIFEPNDGVYQSGTSVTLTAVPNADYLFDGWSGSVSDTVNPLTIVMDEDKSITATFIEDTSSHVGINTYKSIQQLKIYPNPANEVVYVATDEKVKGVIYIFRSDGVFIRREKIKHKTAINTSNLPVGLYLIQFIPDNGEVMHVQSLYITH